MHFVYRDGYGDEAGATPLSVSMPTTVQRHERRVVYPWISNLLPDNERVLQRWGQEFQVSPGSPFRLLEHVGGDVAGAARLLRPEVNEVAGSIQWLTEDDIAAIMAELARDPSAWTTRHALGHFSLAGAQAKTALRWDGKRWGLPSGAEPTTHILKPSAVGLEHQALNEHLCLRAAPLVNLIAARTRLQDFGGTPTIIVERYDRLLRNKEVSRIHQEDMCQAMSMMPTRKYQQDGGPSVPAMVALLRRVVSTDRVDEQVERVVRAVAYSWVIAGTDAHAKNFSLLLSGEHVRLAPLYDIHSVLPYLSSERRSVPAGKVSIRKARMAMRIGAEYRINAVTQRDWIQLADDVGMEGEAVMGIVRDVVSKAPDAFAKVVSDERASGLLDPAQVGFAETLSTLVEQRAKHCAAILQGRGPRDAARRGRRQGLRPR